MFNRVKLKIKSLKCSCQMISDYTGSFPNSLQELSIQNYLKSAPHLEKVQPLIPKSLLDRKKKGLDKNLYLVDSKLASNIAKEIVPKILKYKDAIICEANPGFGFLTDVLEKDFIKLRLYENHPDLRQSILEKYKNENVEVYFKDIFHMWNMSYLDKYDKGKRVKEFLNNVPKKDWNDDPSLVIIGIMPHLYFMNYLMKVIAFQSEFVMHGRTELYVIVRPGDYLKLTGEPHLNYPAYQAYSVLYKTFCETTLLAKLPREAFFPWDSKINISSKTRFVTKYELDKLYLVHIKLKERFDLEPQQYLPFYYFVKQIFGRGHVRIIPKLEQWISDIGCKVIVPEKIYNLKQDIDIYTNSGQLTPEDILSVFQIFYNHPKYANSPFTAMVEGELVKFETVESDLVEVNTVKS